VTAAPAPAWHVVFEAGGVRSRFSLRGLASERPALEAAFSDAIRTCMRRGGCVGFFVTVHVDGADCDHEV